MKTGLPKYLMTFVLTFLCALILITCKARKPEFVSVTNGAGTAVNTETQRSLYELTGRNPEQLTVMRWEETDGQYDEKEVPLNGVVYKGVYEKRAMDIIKSNYGEFDKRGYTLFLTNLSFDDEWKVMYDLAVAKGYSAHDLLELYQVSGPNYDITNEQVIEQIKKWEEHMTFRFITFDLDRFDALITSMDYDIRKLAQENYDLCPDVIEQGYDEMDELVKGLNQSKLLWCWWD